VVRLLAFGAIVTGLMYVALAPRPGEPAAVKPRPHVEERWLSREAAAELFDADGHPGPLFAGVEIGGPAPSQEVEARIAAFARANHIDVDLEIHDAELAAIRIDVTYGGCCGYEGADVLALRLHRPTGGGGCLCGEPWWLDDWSFTTSGVHARVAVRVARVTVRWEKELSLADLVARADEMIGESKDDVRDAAGDRWIEVAREHYLLEMPHTNRWMYACSPLPLDSRDDLGAYLTTEHGQITEVAFTAGSVDDAEGDPGAVLRARWGRPRVRDGVWTWNLHDRIVTAERDYGLRVTIRTRG
jgi:hypothetical protein